MEIRCLADDVELQPIPIIGHWGVVAGLIDAHRELQRIEHELLRDGGVELDPNLTWHLDRLIAFVPVIVGLLPEEILVFR